MRALVTGASGFVGGHLTALLLAQGWEVWGCASSLGAEPATGVQWIRVDLEQPEAAVEAVQQAQPDVIFHLAAKAAVAPSFANPWDCIRTNVGMQVHVLEAVRRHRPECGVLVVSSGEIYGRARPEAMPLREDTPLAPSSPYAVSKATQDLLAQQYHLSFGLKVVRVRPFNHFGPGQAPGFVAADFARQVVQAELGRREPVMRVGNLEARRDFTDVRDVVRAYLALTEGEHWGRAFNVASGVGTRIQGLLDVILAQARVPVQVERDPALMRPSDVPEFVGDAMALRQATGWSPCIPLQQTVSDLLDYWRCHLAASGET